MQALRANAVIGGREVQYYIRTSRTAQRLRIRVGAQGIEVVQPASREMNEAEAFLHAHASWVVEQLDRVARLRLARKAQHVIGGQILLHGEPMRVCIEEIPSYRGGNRIECRDGAIAVVTGSQSAGVPARSLERWLRKAARTAIEEHASVVADSLGVTLGRLYIMDQRTKWGNCSALGNLSFNWRIVMAPAYVLQYLVTHEVVHLAIPDHSRRFWLTVQSICRETERGRQWLAANSERLMIDLEKLFKEAELPRGLSARALPGHGRSSVQHP
jgi:predicted metal-dependent hydrolase